MKFRTTPRLAGTLAAIAVFAACTGVALAAAGSLTFLEQDKDGVGGVAGLNGAIDVAVAPGGANVYAVGNNSNAVVTFTRDTSTGALAWLEQDKDGVGGVDGLAGAWGVAVSPGGNTVYVAGDADNAVTTFSRDPGSGALTFVEQDKDGVGGVDGLAVATGVAVAPGGANVYVGSCGDNAVATFTRDATTGALTFLEQDKQGVGGVDGLACARGVAVDGSGASVYVAAESGDDVATFARNSATGALTFVEQDTDGVGGVDGLNGARDVTTSADCATVYVASAVDDSVATLSRDPGTGALTFVEQDKDGVAGVDGIDQTVGVAVSENGANVYATGENDDAVATFTRETAANACGTPPPVGPGPTPVDPGGGVAARTITFAASKKKVKKGKQVTLSGDLSAPTAATACESGQAVEIQRMPKGKKAFTAAAQVTSAANGTFTAKLKVKKTTQFRAIVSASASCAAAESAATKVKAKKKKQRN
jgi:6-phosphogluconolactonase (cycloisomerase 2 family)